MTGQIHQKYAPQYIVHEVLDRARAIKIFLLGLMIGMAVSALIVGHDVRASGMFPQSSYNPANVTITGGTAAFTAAPGGSGGLQVGTGGGASAGLILGNLAPTGFGAIWATKTVPGQSNFVLATDGSTTVYNALSNAALAINNTHIIDVYSYGASVTGNLSATGTIAATSIDPSIGANNFLTNSAEVVGMPSEYIEAHVAAPPTIASGTYTNATSITLSPGIWDVSAVALFQPSGTTNVTEYQACIGPGGACNILGGTSGNLSWGYGGYARRAFPAGVPNAGNETLSLGPTRMVISTASTSVFLSIFSSFTVNTMNGGGMIRARRIK